MIVVVCWGEINMIFSEIVLSVHIWIDMSNHLQLSQAEELFSLLLISSPFSSIVLLVAVA